MFSNSIANGDGWGGDLTATMWMVSLYKGFKYSVTGDTLYGSTQDARFKTTFILPGITYPNLIATTTLSDGSTAQEPLVYSDNNGTKTSPSSGWFVGYFPIKKNVVGKSPYVSSSKQRYPNHTLMMRLAEMYLIYADACITGSDTVTTDPTALSYYNTVHSRSVPDSSITVLSTRSLLYERAREFAMEGRFWFDLASVFYWNPNLTLSILNSQYRGGIDVFTDQNTDASEWWVVKMSGWSGATTPNVNTFTFQLPIPASEVTMNPLLGGFSVDYYLYNKL
jgi:hypothetical protein